MSPLYRPAAAELAACEAALHAFFRRKAPARDCDDLKQEVWLRLCRRPPTSLQQGLCAYALGIARHLLWRYYQRQRARPVDPLTPSLYGTEPRLADCAVYEGGDWASPARLRLLSPSDRELLELRYDDELSLAEIAARYAIPVGTVKSRLNHTHARLRVLLRPPVACGRLNGSTAKILVNPEPTSLHSPGADAAARTHRGPHNETIQEQDHDPSPPSFLEPPPLCAKTPRFRPSASDRWDAAALRCPCL